jgi:uncharacterized protein YydD (DUF2326 family)
MKLTGLYSNNSDKFERIDFASGLNVVLAEIRLPENKNKDTHNLGKTTLGRLLDYCFLLERTADFFLFKYETKFKDFVFFLEIELEDGTFLTVRRGITEATKISFKRHAEAEQDFNTLPDEQWDHLNVGFEKAKEILDGLLDWRFLKPWSYRKVIGYLLRAQEDFREVFQLRKFQSKHMDWKPFLAHVLGFNGQLQDEHYKREEDLEVLKNEVDSLRIDLGSFAEDQSKIEGILMLKRQEVEKKQTLLDAFDFRSQDKTRNKQIVDEIDGQIAELNGERYSLSQSRKKVVSSLAEDRMLFDPEEATKLFGEAGVLFAGQLKKDYEQLIAFNRAITEERRQYLEEERAELDARIKKINFDLNSLGKKRSDALAVLTTNDAFAKYKKLSDELVILKADITSLERQRDAVHKLQELRAKMRTLADEKRKLEVEIVSDVERQDADGTSMFSSIRSYFSEIVEAVIGRKALLSVSINNLGHLDFSAEILDESGNSTGAGAGSSYRKFLCVAFDLAVLRAHIADRFPRFIYHDGVFEALDERKKESLLEVLREYANLGLQPIITLIDSDMPLSTTPAQPVFSDTEIVVRLHDMDETGRLFKMDSW